MAKKKITELSFYDIVTRSQADVIQEALNARLKIDALLIERDEAYLKIAALENEIEEIVGDGGNFTFEAPPIAVSGFPGYKAPKKTAPKNEEINKAQQAEDGQSANDASSEGSPIEETAAEVNALTESDDTTTEIREDFSYNRDEIDDFSTESPANDV